MVEVKVGDTFSSHYDFSNAILETRTVIKVSDKSIWFKSESGEVFRVKNTRNEGYYMKEFKDFDIKHYYRKD